MSTRAQDLTENIIAAALSKEASDVQKDESTKATQSKIETFQHALAYSQHLFNTTDGNEEDRVKTEFNALFAVEKSFKELDGETQKKVTNDANEYLKFLNKMPVENRSKIDFAKKIIEQYKKLETINPLIEKLVKIRNEKEELIRKLNDNPEVEAIKAALRSKIQLEKYFLNSLKTFDDILVKYMLENAEKEFARKKSAAESAATSSNPSPNQATSNAQPPKKRQVQLQ